MSIIDRDFECQLLDRDGWAMVMLTGIYLFSILIHFNIPTTTLGMYNLAIPLLAIGILWLYRDLLLPIWRCHRLTMLLTLGLYIWAWISALFGGYIPIAAKYTIKYSSYFILFPSLLTLCFAFRRNRKTLWIHHFFLAFTLFIAGFGIIDYVYPRFPVLIWIRTYVNPFGSSRLMSVFDNPTQLGVIMVFGVLNAYIMRKLKYIKTWLAQLSILVCFAIGIGSGSRNFILTLFLSFIFAIYPCRLLSKREIIGSSLIVIFFIFTLSFVAPTTLERSFQTLVEIPQNLAIISQVLNGNLDSLLTGSIPVPDRLQIWLAAMSFIQQSPITGRGFQVFTQTVMEGGFNAHNLILGILTDFGFPGLIFLGGIFISALYSKNIYDSRVFLLCGFIFTAQLIDYFLHSFSIIITMIFLLANAANLPEERQIKP
ncbi:MAG: O-antigen ligase family protein [Cyanobacteria bacterium P01_G01_bin.54]